MSCEVAIGATDPFGAVHDTAVERVNPVVDPRWDAELANVEGSTFFHGSAWARVLVETYGFKPVYFLQRQADRIQALLPMMEIDSWLTGRRGVSLPFTDECAPLFDDPAFFRRVLTEALDYAKLRKWDYAEFRGGLAEFDGAPASASFLGHSLDLRGGEAALFNQIASSARRAVRKAEASGMRIETSSGLDAVHTFYGLFCKTRRRHGAPPQPRSFFESIHRNILARGLGSVFLAWHGKVPIAGAVYFHFGRKVLYKFGASDEGFNHLRANNLVFWEAIRHYSRDSFEVLDFGRTSLTNVGLQKFKLSWGASERRIDYVRQNCRTGGYAIVGDISGGWQSKLLGMVPDPLFKLVGSALYKHIA